MEHRCTRRGKASRNVFIHTRRGKTLKGIIRNVSREGMYIETSERDIKNIKTIDIELTSGCCIRGWVVHIDSEGVGVLFVPPRIDPVDSSSPPVPLSNACLECIKSNIPEESPI